jgi:hypothetical protein
LEAGVPPEPLRGKAPSQRAWKAFLGRQARENPIRIADRIQQQARLPSSGTYAQLAAHFGISRAMVAYHLALLTRLPADFVTWLRACDDPGILGVLTERRLRPVTRLTDPGRQQEVLATLRHEAEQQTQGKAKGG